MNEKLSKFGLFCAFVGAIAAIVAAIASVQSVNRMSEQNRAILEQNIKIAKQIELQGSQNDQQKSDSVAARRLQALNALYDSVEPSGGGTTPRADQRTRAEAIKYFVELEHNREKGTTCADAAKTTADCIVLTSALLQRTDLRDAELPNVVLADAKFQSAQLLRTNLSGAYLRGADFTDTLMSYTNLSYANLQNAVLSKATLNSTDLRCADLTNANLQDIIYKTDSQRIQIENALITTVKNAPLGFMEFATGANAFVGEDIASWKALCARK